MAGMPELAFFALKQSFMENARYEFMIDDHMREKAFHGLLIQTASVPGGIPVTSGRAFEQALCALVRELIERSTQFSACKDAVITLLDEPGQPVRRPPCDEDLQETLESRQAMEKRRWACCRDTLVGCQSRADVFKGQGPSQCQSQLDDRKRQLRVARGVDQNIASGWHDSLFWVVKKRLARDTLEHFIEMIAGSAARIPSGLKTHCTPRSAHSEDQEAGLSLLPLNFAGCVE